MPAAIGAFLLGDALAGLTVAGSLTLGTITGYTVLAGAVALLSLLLPTPTQKTAAQQQTVKQALPSRQLAGGRVKLGGFFVFDEIADGTLVQAIYHCEGPIDAFEEWWLSDTNAGIAGGSLGGENTALPWSTLVTIESHLGATDQAASAKLMATFPGSWTADHHLYGLAYSVVAYALPGKPAKNFQRYYTSGAPALRVVVRASHVYDPRQSGQAWTDPTSWTWSNNAALLVLWYLAHPRGMAIPQSRIYLPDFAAFADLSDQTVALKAGGTVPRYTIGAVLSLTDEPRANMAKLLAACDGELVTRQDGSIGIRGGQWVAPTVTITADMVLGYEYQESDAKLAAFNSLKITYTEPAADYQPIEGETWDDLDDQVVRGVLAQDLPVECAQSHSQARRIAKITMAKGNPRHQLTLTTTIAGLVVAGEETIILTLPELGLDEAFRVTSFAPADDLASCTIGVSSFAATAYDWDPATEEGTPSAYQTSTAVQTTAPLPIGLDIEPVRTTVSATVAVIRARATVTQPSDPNAQYWELAGRYRLQGATAWLPMTQDGDPDAVLTDVLADGGTYEIEVRFEGLGTVSDWTATQTFAAVSDPTAPALPTGLNATASGSTATVTWTNPNSGNFAAAHVYRGATTSFAAATLVATVAGAPSAAGSFVDPGLAAGPHRYFVAAANGSGVESAPIGPATVTI